MKKIAIMTLVMTFGSIGFAKTKYDKRQENQAKRIEKGIESGQLTKKEAAKLKRGQKKIEAMEKRAKADGTVTAKEARRLKRVQKRQSKKIRRKKHNKRK